jgi:hypothetical protein
MIFNQCSTSPSLLTCFLTIVAVKIMLKWKGFGRTLQYLHRRLSVVAVAPGAHDALVRATERNVALMAALYPGRARCLEQSLALYWLLRRRGVPVEFAIGAQPYPFAAHAWVTYNGKPVNDLAEHVAWYLPLPLPLP